ncbi:hypothetical protein HZH66_008571 [Vespula vulgaris]|uniref:Uncharacterized protein n=1 Tax=Vespula vulgaris TaxID=7454 RepID=A0A834JQ33_VESVU|nr:hypothetical protein HZH66_008571 [Vespula vulgaris]
MNLLDVVLIVSFCLGYERGVVSKVRHSQVWRIQRSDNGQQGRVTSMLDHSL